MDKDKTVRLERALIIAIECENIGGSRIETLMELYNARMDKFLFVGSYENKLRFSVDAYLVHRGYKEPITTEIEFEE